MKQAKLKLTIKIRYEILGNTLAVPSCILSYLGALYLHSVRNISEKRIHDPEDLMK